MLPQKNTTHRSGTSLFLELYIVRKPRLGFPHKTLVFVDDDGKALGDLLSRRHLPNGWIGGIFRDPFSTVQKLAAVFVMNFFWFFESWFWVPVVVLIASGSSLESLGACWRIFGQLSFVCNPANFQSPP
jgi:hypothetical protein